MSGQRWSMALVLAAAVACGAKKPAEEPENSEDTASSASPASSEAPLLGGDTPASSKPAPGDDPAKKSTPCSGFDIPDLPSVISQAACEVPSAAADAKQREVKDVLEIQVVPQAAKVQAGAKVEVLVTLKNKGKADLPLDFVVDPEPHFAFEVYTIKGTRADRPSGPEPALDGPAPVRHTARVTLAAQGTARLTLAFDAVKYKWASKERAKGAVAGRGYPRDPAGPLPRGKYVLRVVTPLTGIFEGIDHEISQPRVPIEVN